jgi:hypothetical protein
MRFQHGQAFVVRAQRGCRVAQHNPARTAISTATGKREARALGIGELAEDDAQQHRVGGSGRLRMQRGDGDPGTLAACGAAAGIACRHCLAHADAVRMCLARHRDARTRTARWK